MQSILFDKTFRDETGAITIAQPPNLSLIIWLAATFINRLPTSGMHKGLVGYASAPTHPTALPKSDRI